MKRMKSTIYNFYFVVCFLTFLSIIITVTKLSSSNIQFTNIIKKYFSSPCLVCAFNILNNSLVM